MAFEREKEIGLAAVKIATILCQTVQAKINQVGKVDKSDASPVTIADFGTQALISQALAEAFPEVPLVGEEDAADLRADASLCAAMMAEIVAVDASLSTEGALNAIDRGTYEGGATGRHWVLDPIDGTKGFLRGDQYAIALGLIEDGKVVMGVLGCPNLPNKDGTKGAIFVASEGEGAEMFTLDGVSKGKISVSEVSVLAEANFCESVERGHSSHSHSAQIATKLGITSEPYRIDSQCKYAAVGRGDAAIYLRLPTRPGYQEKIWDHAAGVAVIIEAGGTVTDVYGKKLDFSLGRTLANNKGVVVSNGQFHAEVLVAVRDVLGL
jgi:3'(2'), 5'-bisphosphate nucleotidase